ncbi:phosphatidate cytidylyltransferase [Domibacillus epiphyticus]|uniref:Phosphatidate cytidylyltransferase n=1 Tax=Domibacillus epiphyticus TaxID=1714355 RepID=A0A1V2ACB8_9BACI|nr:phosphatidate cytidylyltransferase [Domibacillus epiphyticus]OMP68635.1 phosphatidate cytidylyltransferase [Domibacillus epiphyticus]
MKQRIVTGVIAAAAFLPIVLYGGVPFIVLVFLMSAAAVLETLKMRGIRAMSLPGLASVLLSFLLLMPSSIAQGWQDAGYGKMELTFIFVLLLLVYTVLSKNRFTFDEAAFCVLVPLYIGFGFSYMIETREEGIAFVFFALLVTWASDSGAYFVGRSIGKRKLWPEISPNKTVAGFFGGIGSAVIVAVIFLFILDFEASAVWVLLATAFLSVAGQIGDLAESALKRHYNVKDSGSLLPGHGGILDRTDSWLFVFPLLHMLQLL